MSSPCIIALSLRNNTIALSFLPSLDKANGGLCQKNCCYHGNVMSHSLSIRYFFMFSCLNNGQDKKESINRKRVLTIVSAMPVYF